MNDLPFLIALGVYVVIVIVVLLLNNRVKNRMEKEDEEWEDWM